MARRKKRVSNFCDAPECVKAKARPSRWCLEHSHQWREGNWTLVWSWRQSPVEGEAIMDAFYADPSKPPPDEWVKTAKARADAQGEYMRREMAKLLGVTR